MKENVDILRTYNLVNSNGNKLRLYLGRIEESDDYFGDKGFRWCFVGNRIPMPVRSGTWFNGFPEHIMLDWLKGNGWALHTSVSTNTGIVTVYELPFYDEPSKGNEKSIDAYQMSDHAAELNKEAFEEAIRIMYSDRGKVAAIRLYRYAHPCLLCDANRAVDAILDSTP